MFYARQGVRTKNVREEEEQEWHEREVVDAADGGNVLTLVKADLIHVNLLRLIDSTEAPQFPGDSVNLVIVKGLSARRNAIIDLPRLNVLE